MSSPIRTTSSRASRRAIPMTAGLLALIVTLVLASPAMAGKPTGEYKVFNDCPLGSAGVNECVFSQTTGGELLLGKMSVPITNTITFQGGQIVSGSEETFVAPTEGVTLSKTPETVTGGFEMHTVTATLELVGTVVLSRKKLAAGEGTALQLPSRVHLKNEIFGESCFVGSSTSPITITLTTGSTSPPAPNKSIKGSPGTLESKEGGNLLVYSGDSLVDNAFAVSTGAKGCGGSEESLIDPLLDSLWGLPSAAGHNTAILKGTSKFASALAVKESE
jgi:hypothetical protein